MKRVYDFLFHLSRNNNKPWFDAHKDQYLQAKKIFEDLLSKGYTQIDVAKLMKCSQGTVARIMEDK